MHIEVITRDQVVAQLMGSTVSSLELSDALVEVTAALPELFSVDGAGLLLVDEEQALRCICSTDPLAGALEAAQEETGTGPCVDSFVDGVLVAVDDTGTDPRWPLLSPLLAGAGIGAILGVPVLIGGAPVGSLNVYTKEPRIWDESDAAAIGVFAGIVGHLFTATLVGEQRGRLAGQLQHALDTRLSVERAIGMLMVLNDFDGPGAFAALRQAARSARVPVREIAEAVVRDRRPPS